MSRGRLVIRKWSEFRNGSTECSNQLNSSWDVWYEDRSSSSNTEAEWGGNQQQVATFSTIEEFWGIYGRLRPVNDLPENGNYHYFKTGIKPSWEDEANKDGGSWRLGLHINDHYLEERWQSILLSVIGETLDPTGSSVCGVSFLKKSKGYRVEVWMKDAANEREIATVGRRLRALNAVEKREKMEFRKHGGDVKYIL
ncbi:Translation initiation factor 4E (eIF-4E) [Blastocystis hominis]|uniref:Translation initiation factor 4E (EIF-4E) n=1 Tax=Blastocystis hominis TaxID=12968 RepID=D8M3G0_BLAHO|nr:Translation initiation factor 4E (eIF-4E) [Blastocystis hominis]CBK22433.2 Translation initiation factor 4E (eIF-4E) [Blastocystis hominis]|eukprot:XP_012896481.1 Translation initiation factor 4E (eIF-4E) [Blastocystis hominis]